MSHGIPCAVCGWIETAHAFPAEYPQCAHPYVSQCDVIDEPDDEQQPADHE